MLVSVLFLRCGFPKQRVRRFSETASREFCLKRAVRLNARFLE